MDWTGLDWTGFPIRYWHHADGSTVPPMGVRGTAKRRVPVQCCCAWLALALRVNLHVCENIASIVSFARVLTCVRACQGKAGNDCPILKHAARSPRWLAKTPLHTCTDQVGTMHVSRRGFDQQAHKSMHGSLRSVCLPSILPSRVP
jgi:hypothetical protein